MKCNRIVDEAIRFMHVSMGGFNRNVVLEGKERIMGIEYILAATRSSSHSYGSSYGASSGASILPALLLIALIVLVFVAFLVSINLFIEAAKQKGHYKDGGSAILWFVGIFATPIVVGLYTSALPDLNARKEEEKKEIGSDLPTV